MKYGFLIPGGDVRDFAGFAATAEAAGWDGVFVADAISTSMGGKTFPWFDPWVALATMATATTRVRLGTFLTAPARRRPWKLAREVGTLDELSSGRAILSVGLGAADGDAGFSAVGEAMELRVRAELVDEALEIINGLWKGRAYSFKGMHYNVTKMAMLPKPIQKPRIPIWVVGVWPKEKSMQRALRWDGVIPQRYKLGMGEWEEYAKAQYAQDVRAIREYAGKHGKRESFDIVVQGFSSAKNRQVRESVKALETAGATWYIQNLWTFDPKKITARIKQGPPA